MDTKINHFYQRGHDLGLAADTVGPVEFAVAVQTTDIGVDSMDKPVDYYLDRTKYRSQTWRSSLTSEDKVRARYTEALPYAQAAYTLSS